MTDTERRDVTELVRALQRVEWVDGKCPYCSRTQAYGLHVCSCPRRLALRAGARLLGTDVAGALPVVDEDAQGLIANLRDASEGGDRLLTGLLGMRAAAMLERLTN